MDLKKTGSKKQGHCYSKREEAACSLFFLNNNDPVFLHPDFCNPYFEPFFSSSQTDPCFQNKNSGCRLTGRVGTVSMQMRIHNSFCIFVSCR